MNIQQAYLQVSKNETVSFRPYGNSMSGRVESGQLVAVEPLGESLPRRGDIVLCKVRGRVYLHLVKAVRGGQYLIGNNIGGTNGWTTRVVGQVVSIGKEGEGGSDS